MKKSVQYVYKAFGQNIYAMDTKLCLPDVALVHSVSSARIVFLQQAVKIKLNYKIENSFGKELINIRI